MRQTSWLVIAVASVGLVAASACNQGKGQAAGPTYPMYSGPQAPAATGAITAATDGNGNTALTIHVRNLAHPSRLAPNATTYVVWIVPLQGQQQLPPAGPGQQPMQNPGMYGTPPGQQGFVTSQPPMGDQQGGQAQQPPEQGMQGQGGDVYSQGLPPNAGAPINVGVIKLGSNMSGQLHVSTSFSQFEVLITPESDPSVQQPINAPVLVARVIRG